MVEPDHLLQPSYFNRAHNDWLELVLDGGILAAALLAVAAGWWLYASWKAWTSKPARDLPRLGSAAVLLVMLASIPDYPARTPMIMAILALAALWLTGNTQAEQRRAAAVHRG
jgi:O-antigen ligase